MTNERQPTKTELALKLALQALTNQKVLLTWRQQIGAAEAASQIVAIREALREEQDTEQLFCYQLDEEGRSTIIEIVDNLVDGQVVWLEHYRQRGELNL